jgi:hypothetical protein
MFHLAHSASRLCRTQPRLRRPATPRRPACMMWIVVPLSSNRGPQHARAGADGLASCHSNDPCLSGMELGANEAQKTGPVVLPLPQRPSVKSIRVHWMGRLLAPRVMNYNNKFEEPTQWMYYCFRCTRAALDLIRNHHGDAPPTTLSTDHDFCAGSSCSIFWPVRGKSPPDNE